MFLVVFYRFLIIMMRSSPTTTIATIMPIVEGSMYRSATDAGGSVGGGVDSGASCTISAVSADDP